MTRLRTRGLRTLGCAIAPLFILTCAAQANQHKHVARHGHHARASAASDGTVTYNRDSPDPNIGWHNDGHGMRVCTQDCDNPEIPGSGFTCKSVQLMGMTARECDK